MEESIYSKISNILSLCSTQNSKRTPGVAEGHIGELLSLSYLWNYSRDKCFLDAFNHSLETIIDSSIIDCSLGYGAASLGWLLNLIQREKLLNGTFVDKIDLEDINKAVEKEVYLMVDARNFDYFRGSLGILYYLSQIRDISHFERAADYFVKEVEICLKERYDFSIIRSLNGYTEKVINMGVPHGITGILLILLIVKEKCAHLCSDKTISNFAQIILSYRFKGAKNSYFPSFVHHDGRKEPSGIAWCYGDLMISYAFFKIDKLLGRQEYSKFAREMVTQILINHNFEIIDLCLCHGLPSLYYIFKRVYNISHIVKCYSLAEKIYQKLENLFFQDLEKFKQFEGNPFFKNPSLFYGYPAPLLTILSKNNPTADWQKCLLL